MNRFAMILAILMVGCAGGPAPEPAPKPPEIPPKEYPVNESFQILPDRVIQGTDKEAVALSPTSIKTTYFPGERTWTLKSDISAFPSFTSPQMPILEALYNLTLEEAQLNIKKEGTLMAGKAWTGVWTRDISYAIHLALGIVLPQQSMNSLKFKVNALEQVIQDTGTGGSWPISTDRVVWAIAAWDIYTTSGDKAWLEYAYRILKNTAEKDLANVVDPITGLYFGESSFMDWREQTYPKWMEPKDIYESKALGTNVLHQQVLSILGQMAKELGKPAGEAKAWTDRSAKLATSINKEFWLADKKYLSVYQYPSQMGNLLSDKTETLGSALAVYFGVTDPAKSKIIMENLPVVPFGPPIIYPQHAHANPYHNKAIWPFVTAYYGLAGAKIGNEAAVSFALKSNIRVATLFLTNKENLTYDTGKDKGTAINSDRQLWSVGGQLAGYYIILFGLNPRVEGLSFAPVVPDFIQGPLSLKGYPYRQAKVNVNVTGKGSKIVSLQVNGVEKGPSYILPTTSTGELTVDITLEGTGNLGQIALSPLLVGPRDPQGLKGSLSADGTFTLTWRAQPGVAKTEIYKNGKLLTTVEGATWQDTSGTSGVYFLRSLDEMGLGANYSEYVYSSSHGKSPIIVKAESGIYPEGSLEKDETQSWVNLVKGTDKLLSLELSILTAGNYNLSWKYFNDNGPVSTDNKTGIRTLKVDGKILGTQVFPQRGGAGERFGSSNSLVATLSEGIHKVELIFLPMNENMNIDINEAGIVHLEARLLP